MPMPEISEQHLLFIEEYIKDRNATRAALAVNLSTTYKGARQAASVLLTNPDIRMWVKRLLREAAKRLKYTPAKTLRNWMLAQTVDLTCFRVDDKGNLTTAPGVPHEYLRMVRKIRQVRTIRLTDKGNELAEEIKTDIELRDAFGPEVKLMEHFKELKGEDKDAGAVAAMGQLAALLAGRVNAAGGSGGVAGDVPGGTAVDPEAAADSGVSQPGG